MNASNVSRVNKLHTDAFVSLHGLTAGALPSLYTLLCFTARKVYLIGNLQQLKKVRSDAPIPAIGLA